MNTSLPSVPQVMLIEDDPELVYLMQRYARNSGCHLLHVDSIDQTVPLAQKELPNLILIDLALNGVDGWQVLKSLRADPVTCNLPVFVFSASEVVVHGWEEYADGCLLMPVIYEDFASALATAMSRFPANAIRQQDSRRYGPVARGGDLANS